MEKKIKFLEGQHILSKTKMRSMPKKKIFGGMKRMDAGIPKMKADKLKYPKPLK
jgi:hypothetical protein